MTNLILHDFLVEHAKFHFPATPIGGTAVSTTNISALDVGSLEIEWKALRAVRDKDLPKKLCDTLKNILGETPLTEDLKRSLSRCFLPPLRADGSGVAKQWLKNPSEAHVSIILVPSLYTQAEPLGQSKSLLEHGVFSATQECLLQYGQLEFSTELEQGVEEAKSIVDFHALVEDKIVAVVEAKSPKVMHRLGELQTQNAFEVRWTSGSGNLVSQIFSKVGLGFLIRE